MKNLFATLRSLAFAGIASTLALVASAAEKDINVMLLTGQCSRYHNWELSSRILNRILDDAGRFQVDVVTTPPKGADMSAFAPDFSQYQVVVMDYEGDEWPEPTKAAFAKFISDGGGLVTFHDTDNAFPKWQEWLDMTAVGGWAGRDESWGPKIRWRDGKMVLDDSPGTATHPPQHDFLIEVRSPGHPVMKGMPPKWMHARDELYSQLRGPAKNVEVLATAYADKESVRNGTGENEPMIMAITYGKGRVIHNTLGHVGPRDQEPVASVDCVGFITTLQRSTEWAATGRVTIPIPADFPTAESTSLRKH